MDIAIIGIIIVIKSVLIGLLVHARIAQRKESLPSKQIVAGSNPAAGTLTGWRWVLHNITCGCYDKAVKDQCPEYRGPLPIVKITSRAIRRCNTFWHLMAGNTGAAERKLNLLLGKKPDPYAIPTFPAKIETDRYYREQQIALDQAYMQQASRSAQNPTERWLKGYRCWDRVSPAEAMKWLVYQRDRLYNYMKSGILTKYEAAEELRKVTDQYKMMIGGDYGTTKEVAQVREWVSPAAISTAARTGKPVFTASGFKDEPCRTQSLS